MTSGILDVVRYRTFMVVWFGQLVSNIGSSLTRFALAFWVYEATGSTTQLALVILFARLPALLITPFAGAIVDRWPRRKAMILSDAGAAIGTVAITVLLATDALEVWHLYIALGISGAFGSFQQPAYTAATSLLIPKEHHGRAAGLVQLAGSAGMVLGPFLGAAVLVAGGLTTVFVLDLVTFGIAVLTLVSVRFPEPVPEPRLGRGILALLKEAKVGFDYVKARPGLIGLMLTFSLVNFAVLFHSILIFPLLLSFTSETRAGIVISSGAFGMVVGSAVMSVWGGPKNRIPGLMVALSGMGLGLVIAGLRASPLGVSIGIFVILFCIPIAAGTSQAVWQSKIPPELQGRVFSFRLLLAMSATPVSFLLAGPLADRFFEPLLSADGALAGTLGAIIGTGPGRGIGAFFIALGVFIIVVAAYASTMPTIWNLDSTIPDVDLEPAGATA